MTVELKMDSGAEAALAQAEAKRYAGALTKYSGTALRVGISYDRKTKRHTCKIERETL